MKPKKTLLLILATAVTLTGTNAQTIDNIADFAPYKSYNYIFSKTVLIPQTGSTPNYREVFQYYDGLGRLIQTVDYKASPKKNDIIQPVEYDQFGREPYKYLLYADTINSATKKGVYRDSWKTEQSSFYTVRYGTTDGPKAFACTKFEDSPLNRVMKQGAPGNIWQPNTSTTTRQSSEHVISYQYAANTAADSVYYWTISGTYPSVTFTRKSYNVNTLYKNIVTDENGNPTTEFKDLQGKVVMKKDALNGKTFYIYDDFELLRCVIPPLASQTLAARTKTSFTTSESDFQELCYYYEYDKRQRMIKKKLPGTVGVYEMKYNNRDLLEESKDPNGNRLQYYYDELSRLFGTVLIKPDGTEEIISTTTYDDYYSIDAKYQYVDKYGYPKETCVKGKVTITTAKVIEPGTIPKTELKTVYYYDKYGRLIQTVADNHLGGIDRISFRYKYKNSELIAEKKHEHCTSNTAITDSISEYNYFDHAGRVRYTTLRINNDITQTLAVMTYDEMGQMVQKNLGSLGLKPVKLNYKYNIRGWLTQINNPDNVCSSLFGLRLSYVSGDIDVYYNGNIGMMEWSSSCNIKGLYYFDYDKLNRLSSARYCEYQSGQYYTPGENKYSESFTYDANGNIRNVFRRGALNDGTGLYGLIDKLSYAYFNSGRSNRLYAVGDAAADVMFRGDFLDGSKGFSSQEYFYDNNGNMTRDNNNGNLFKYNFLNLPYYYSSMYDLRISYDATGRKLRYDNTDYIGPFLYERGVLKYIITSEGRAIPKGTTYNYEYHIKDHLGNVRVAFIDASGTPQVVQTNNYYSFGMLMAERTNTAANKNPYLYNGKEMFSGEYYNWYDYGKRFYDPQIAHWPSPDPRAEKYYNWSPYCYAADNPIFFIDPQGDTLNVTGNAAAINTFNQINSQGTGGYYKTTVDKNGNVTLTATGKKGTMTKEQKAYYQTLKTVINSETKTSINVVENDNTVIVGDAATKTIDVGDMKAIDQNNKVVNAPSMLGHEIWEQFNLTYGVPLPDAHVSGSNKEGEIGNYTRNPITGGVIQPDPTRPGAGNELLIIKVDRNGKRSTYIIDLTNRNVTKVVKSEKS
jgi:RHS repeat-associated protein